MNKLLFSIALLTLLISKSVFADESSVAFCKSKLKESAFYNAIRTSPLGYNYNFNDVENNRFAVIDEKLNTSLKQLCLNKSSFEKIIDSINKECERECNKQVASFQSTIFLVKTKGKQDFSDDCHHTCFSMKNTFKAYNQAIKENNLTEEACETNKDSVSNLGRSVKQIKDKINLESSHDNSTAVSK